MVADELKNKACANVQACAGRLIYNGKSPHCTGLRRPDISCIAVAVVSQMVSRMGNCRSASFPMKAGNSYVGTP